MTVKAPLVGLLFTQGLLRSPNQHPCGQGHYGLQFLRALSSRLKQNPNIRLLADHPNTQKECLNQLNLTAGSGPLPWLPPEHWGQLDVLHSFEPSPLAWVRKRGRAPYKSLRLSGTLSHWDAPSLQASVLENFSENDLLFCASKSVQASVQRLWNLETARLQRRFGALSQLPQLPQLLLASPGVALNHAPFTSEDRLAARTTLRVAPDNILIVQAGRVDPARGFDPAALYRVVAEVQKRITPRLQIVDCCSFINETARQEADRAARDLGLTIKRAEIQHPEYLLRCLAAADLYAGLQLDLDMGFNNLHLQAMSAGVPCVLSDWGAHRHAVNDKHNGWLIPTNIPHRSALPAPLQEQTAPWCELISIDFDEAVQAIQTLSTNDHLRQTIAQSGQEWAQAHNWDAVLAQYQAHWQKQSQEHVVMPRPPAIDPIHPALSDLYRPFASLMLNQRSKFWPLLGVGEGSLRAQATLLLADKAPLQQTLPKEQQAATLKDNTQLLQWLRSRHGEGGNAQAAAAAVGRSDGQRLSDMSRLSRLGMARTSAQANHDLLRPLKVLHAGIKPHQQNALQQLTSDGRILMEKQSMPLADELQRAQNHATHVCWLGASTVVRDYWLYERLQEAFTEYAIVLPADITPNQLPSPELETLPWLAIRHDALHWFVHHFEPPTHKQKKSKKNANPWLKLFHESLLAKSPGRIGSWPIDIMMVKETP
jgi:glycosyltransferase involved in cell wall biosynthesis